MRKLIYKLFFVAGICASAFGVSNAPSPIPASTTPVLKAMESSERIYFTDAIQSSDGSQLVAAQGSRKSHSSHHSHYSHVSHYSSSS